MPNASTQLVNEFVAMLEQNALEMGQELSGDVEELRAYTTARLEVVKLSLAEPGFREGLVAERDALALKAAGRAIDRADAFDGRILGIAEAFLATAARALTLL